jgi:nucleoside phosphorylase
MGRNNAQRAVRAELTTRRADLVLTCGFAGGLVPGLQRDSVLFATDPETGLERALVAAGARPARFHCAEKVVTTSQQKRVLWEATGADAVEMESEFIREICLKERIPSATVRVVLDEVGEDLPLDFNELMTQESRIHAGKLALALARAPSKIAALMCLQRHSREASECLARVLGRVITSASIGLPILG